MRSVFLDQQQLPEPLSQEELTMLFQQDPNHNPKILEKIVMHNLRIVVKRINNRFFYGFDDDELFSAGCYGLVKAIQTFDLSKNVKFITYSIRCIDNEILYYIRNNKSQGLQDSLEQSIRVDHDGNEQCLIDVIPEPTSLDFIENIEKKEQYDRLLDAISTLSVREQKVILLHYGFFDDTCVSQKALSNQMNLSQGHISRIASSARRKLAVILKNNDAMFFNEEMISEPNTSRALQKTIKKPKQ